MAAFNADSARDELRELEALLRKLEADGADDESILDTLSDVNELRDQLRNHESFPPIWPAALSGVVPNRHDSTNNGLEIEEFYEGVGWCLRGVLTPTERMALVGAVLRGLELLENITTLPERQLSDDVSHGEICFRKSDDVELAEVLWHRTCEFVPPVLETCVAPAAEAGLRSQLWPEFEWNSEWQPAQIDSRITYELVFPDAAIGSVYMSEAAGSSDAVSMRVDTEETDDRDECGRPLLSLIVALGAEPGVASKTGAGGVSHVTANSEAVEDEFGEDEFIEVEFMGDGSAEGTASRRLRLCPGDATFFRRGDPRLAYRTRTSPAMASSERRCVVLRAKVLYVLRLPERHTKDFVRSALAASTSRFPATCRSAR
eukprot:TRINITY_DN63324_c0_g1_i1.p1 TRINITY_DN63324_c0_g1~~TRINITY_DN63324_c0_g1_i1.p1  ORF type:complete len:374 (-),score=61.61 TRINITY_DN63324_c0_g1_i1:236-1357(-)